jgi:hypothetical protein
MIPSYFVNTSYASSLFSSGGGGVLGTYGPKGLRVTFSFFKDVRFSPVVMAVASNVSIYYIYGVIYYFLFTINECTSRI